MMAKRDFFCGYFHSITTSASASNLSGLEAERLCSLEIDGQFEFGRLHDRQFRRPRPFENSTGIDTSKRQASGMLAP